MSDGLPPAGWYADPTDAGQQRYWDGGAWTEHVAPAAGGAAASTSGAAGAATDAGAQAGGTTSWSSDPLAASSSAAGGAATGGTALAAGGGSAGVDTWTWQSIVATILCCNVLGVVGVLNAGRAEAAQRAGDGAQAAKFAADARRWTLWSGGISIGIFLLFGVLAFVGVLADLR